MGADGIPGGCRGDPAEEWFHGIQRAGREAEAVVLVLDMRVIRQAGIFSGRYWCRRGWGGRCGNGRSRGSSRCGGRGLLKTSAARGGSGWPLQQGPGGRWGGMRRLSGGNLQIKTQRNDKCAENEGDEGLFC